MKSPIVWGALIVLILCILLGIFFAFDLGLIGKIPSLFESQSTFSPSPIRNVSGSRPVTVPQKEPEYVPGEYNVGLKDGVTFLEGRTIVTNLGGVVRGELSLEHDVLFVFLTDEQAALLAKHPNVLWIEREVVLKPLTSSLSFPSFFFNTAYAQGTGSAHLFILEPGVGGNSSEGSFESQSSVYPDVPPVYFSAHGVEVAKTIFQTINNLSLQVRVHSINISTSTGASATDRSIAGGIKQAIDAGADVINLSFECNQTHPETGYLLRDAFQHANRNYVIVVNSAGNTPGSINQCANNAVFSVGGLVNGCVDNNLGANTRDIRADFYAYPYSPGGKYGTSFAAPRIAARVADVMADPISTIADSNRNGMWDSVEVYAELALAVATESSFTSRNIFDTDTTPENGTCLPGASLAPPPASPIVAATPPIPAPPPTQPPRVTPAPIINPIFSIQIPIPSAPPVSAPATQPAQPPISAPAPVQAPLAPGGSPQSPAPTTNPSVQTRPPPAPASPPSAPSAPSAARTSTGSSGILDGPIVPECYSSSIFSGACQLCDLVALANRLVRFAVEFSVAVATLMFAYAGTLYFTATANEGNIKKAHGIFGKVFASLIVILVAWMIIDIIMRTFTNSGGTIGSDITCLEYDQSGSLSGVAAPPGPGGLTAGGRSSVGGSCTPPTNPSNACHSSNLGCFGAQAENASKICMRESNGIADRLSTSDKLADDSDNNDHLDPYSIGLWQINLTVHQVGGLDCPSAFTAPCGGNNVIRSGPTIGRCTARVKSDTASQDLYQQCVRAAQDPEINNQVACRLYNARGNFNDWRNSANNCGVSWR